MAGIRPAISRPFDFAEEINDLMAALGNSSPI